LFFGSPASLTVGGDEVGATLTAPKVSVKATVYSPDFQNAGGAIKAASFITKIECQVSTTINEITAAKLAWSLPGSTSSSGTGVAAADASAFATTTDAATAAGTTYLPMTSVASPLAVGQWLKVGSGALAEFRKVREIIPTAGVLLNEALMNAHDSGVAVVHTVDGDVTTISWSTGRVPTSAFKDVVIDGVGLDGQHLIVTVTDALSDGKLDVEMSDSAVAGSVVTLTGYYDGANPTLCPVTIAVG
jgi:hypothetical protein